MAGRWGLGPVFALEWLTTTRRWQVYAGRALFVGTLLIALSSVWVAHASGRGTLSIQDLASIGQAFYGAIVFTQLTLVLLAAPAATAGAICQDKVQGNLAQLLVTELSNTEVVLGKLAARLVPVLAMVGCTLPVLTLCTLLGGIDPFALAGSFAITLSVAVLGCSVALAFSVWGTKPYEVLLATFAVFTIWLLSGPFWEFSSWNWGISPMPRWAIAANPYFLAFAPYARPQAAHLLDVLGFVSAALVISAILILVSIRRLRPVVIAQANKVAGAEVGPKGLRRELATSRALDERPMLWYEAHRTRPTPWITALIRLYFLLATAFTLLAIQDVLRPSPRVVSPSWFSSFVNAFLISLSFPLLLMAATTALVEERARGSLDILLTTPLPTRGVVLAKWWKAYRETFRLILLPTVVTLPLAWYSGEWYVVILFVLFLLALGAAWTSIGLAISTWIPRIGRAVTTAVILYMLVNLGWPMIVLTFFRRTKGAFLSTLGAFHGPFHLTLVLAEPDDLPYMITYSLIWIITYLVVALVLFLATLATFNRALGRIPERSKKKEAPR